jgi:penicillin-binding protein 2
VKKNILLCCLFLVGCSLSEPLPEATLPNPSVTTVSAPDPELLVSSFLEAWKAQDYASMYAMLSPLSKDALSEEAFTARYGDVWKQAALSGLDYEIVSSLINPQAAQVRYRLTFHSVAVDDFTVETYVDATRSDGEWRVAWTEGAIYPELVGGNGLYLDLASSTRANIYDHNGLALASEGDIVALWVVPNQIGDEESEATMLRSLSRLLGLNTETIRERYDAFRGTNYFIPMGEVSLDDFQSQQGILNSVGGVQWAFYEGRFYGGGGLAPHAVGYVAQIQQEQLDEYLARGYRGDEFVGQTGVELTYEQNLRGIPGGTLYLTDATGRWIKSIASREAQLPEAVYTTLDRSLQRYAQQAISGFTGAIVVLERDTGAVLAMVSSPGFDPNMFNASNPNSGPGLNALFSTTSQPLLNRATHGLYPLGSVFKIITMAAALESGIYQASTEYDCNGEFRELPGQVFYDWTVEKELPPHGEVTLMQGLERSCNCYFWHIGLDLYNHGLQTALPDMAKAFGLGQETGIEIGEAAGQVPDPEWKQQNIGESWGPGDAVQLAIGQASLNITPLQVARFVAAVGNGGTLYQPQIIQRIESPEGVVSHEFQPIVQGTLPVSPENLALIQQAMVQVVRETKGTARRRFMGLSIDIAGKTGTAQSGYGDPHAWFAGYTFEGREDKPDIAVVVLAEYQGEGSEWAAPIFRRVIEAYFFGRPVTLYPWESQIGVWRTATPTPGPVEETATPPPPEPSPTP